MVGMVVWMACPLARDVRVLCRMTGHQRGGGQAGGML